MDKAPILILAYNRPDKVANLIHSLRKLQPSTVLIGIDGPRLNRNSDDIRVAEVHKAVELIDWTDDVHIRGRSENLGLKRAVIDSVNWAIEMHGKAVVIEEDVVVGPQFLDFMNLMLDNYKNENSIGHISGYNVVPRKFISTKDTRLTRYPESIAWGTWERAWKNFDESLEWGTSCSVSELTEIVGSKTGALKWKLNFSDAKSDRISTWAYRWIASMWEQNQFVLSPNENLVTYSGFDSGSHTLTAAPWDELPIGEMNLDDLNIANIVDVDYLAEPWVSKSVFKETFPGLCKGCTVSMFRKLRQEKY